MCPNGVLAGRNWVVAFFSFLVATLSAFLSVGLFGDRNELPTMNAKSAVIVATTTDST